MGARAGPLGRDSGSSSHLAFAPAIRVCTAALADSFMAFHSGLRAGVPGRWRMGLSGCEPPRWLGKGDRFPVPRNQIYVQDRLKRSNSTRGSRETAAGGRWGNAVEGGVPGAAGDSLDLSIGRAGNNYSALRVTRAGKAPIWRGMGEGPSRTSRTRLLDPERSRGAPTLMLAAPPCGRDLGTILLHQVIPAHLHRHPRPRGDPPNHPISPSSANRSPMWDPPCSRRVFRAF